MKGNLYKNCRQRRRRYADTSVRLSPTLITILRITVFYGKVVLVNTLLCKEIFYHHRPSHISNEVERRQCDNPNGVIFQGSRLVAFSRIALSCTKTWSVTTHYDRSTAQSILNSESFLPPSKYSERIGFGRIAHGLDDIEDIPIQANDPRLAMTYAEFPLSSLDILLDVACQYLNKNANNQFQNGYDQVNMVDIGSGIGRIVFYTAMSRSPSWNVHGIEIAEKLHERALHLAQNGINSNILTSLPTTEQRQSTLSLHLGPAEKFSNSILRKADIIFAYSTAFSATSFSPDVETIILDREWSQLLSQACHSGCIAITTDRALDPAYGWKVLERIDVKNPEVLGSTGYIHILVDKDEE